MAKPARVAPAPTISVGGHRRQSEHETTTATVALHTAHAALVALGNLAHQAQAQADAADTFGMGGPSQDQISAASAASGGVRAATVVKDREDPWATVGRNDPCPCGSGKKFKKCDCPTAVKRRSV